MKTGIVMDRSQAKWFLRILVGGKKLNVVTIRELYLSGYVGIDLRVSIKEPIPTGITEKGKQLLKA